ncbi:hypothetical protein BDV18DRAFT_147026 [Aspergillus unguis]
MVKLGTFPGLASAIIDLEGLDIVMMAATEETKVRCIFPSSNCGDLNVATVSKRKD